MCIYTAHMLSVYTCMYIYTYIYVTSVLFWAEKPPDEIDLSLESWTGRLGPVDLDPGWPSLRVWQGEGETLSKIRPGGASEYTIGAIEGEPLSQIWPDAASEYNTAAPEGESLSQIHPDQFPSLFTPGTRAPEGESLSQGESLSPENGASEFIVGGPGRCPNGSQPIADYSSCRVAADALG